MQLYFIRHAQSTNNARWESGEFTDNPRVADPPLTDKGILQSQLVAQELSKHNPGIKLTFWTSKTEVGMESLMSIAV